MNRWRRGLSSAAIGFALTSTVSLAQNRDASFSGVTTGILADICRTHESLKLDPCGAYILGVTDELAVSGRSCRPVNTTSGNLQVEAIVLKYLRDHPERWDRPAMAEVDRALALAFPCAKR
jgi:hypothetical protein